LECGLNGPGDVIIDKEMNIILDGYCDFYVENDGQENKAFRLIMEMELGANLNIESKKDHVLVVG